MSEIRVADLTTVGTSILRHRIAQGFGIYAFTKATGETFARQENKHRTYHFLLRSYGLRPMTDFSESRQKTAVDTDH